MFLEFLASLKGLRRLGRYDLPAYVELCHRFHQLINPLVYLQREVWPSLPMSERLWKAPWHGYFGNMANTNRKLADTW